MRDFDITYLRSVDVANAARAGYKLGYRLVVGPQRAYFKRMDTSTLGLLENLPSLSWIILRYSVLNLFRGVWG